MKRLPDRAILVHMCDTLGRRTTDGGGIAPASLVPEIGDGVGMQSSLWPGARLRVRRRLWLNPDEVELHCREVRG